MYLNGLTAEQQAVVTHVGGPALVIACPGSGKTRSLVHRTAYLTSEQGVRPSRILGITFTRAAANEMKSRLANLIDPDLARQVRLHTFHALAYQILRRHREAPNILADQAQHAMIRQLLIEENMNADQTTVESVLTDFARFVGGQIPAAHFASLSCEPSLFRRLWTRYSALKAEAGFSDFDDLLVEARDLLEAFPQRRHAELERTDHLVVDEFQDTNMLQWQFLQLLIPHNQQIMAVGDDDQAIYGWRGASPSFMLQFADHFAGCRTFHLTRNFRSSRSLVAPAARLIQHNQKRFAKAFEMERPVAQPPEMLRPASPSEEANLVTVAIQEHLTAGESPAAMAVLYRTHLLGLPLINRLERAGIPFRVLGGRPNPFIRWMVRDVLTYLRWAWGEADRDEVLRVLRRPSRRGISKELLADLEPNVPTVVEILPWLTDHAPPAGCHEALTLRDQLATLRTLPARRAIDFIRKEIGYDRYIEQYCEWSGSDPIEARELLTAVAQIPDNHEDSRAYIELARQEENRMVADDPAIAKVTLCSLHGSKGLEWDRVWLIDAVEGATPHRLSVADGALEEERRLFYVGMTRARNALVILSPQSMFGSTAAPSRFLIESGIWAPPPPPTPKRVGLPQATVMHSQPPLPPEDYAPGIRCAHFKFGPGVIHDVSQGTVTIHFQNGDRKTFSLEVCQQAGMLRQLPHTNGARP